MDHGDLTTSQTMIRQMMGFIPARAVLAAAKLGVADHVDADGTSANLLAERLEVDPRALNRLLRILDSIGVLNRDANDKISLTPLGMTLRRDTNESVHDYAIWIHDFIYEGFGGLSDSVRTGKPAFDMLFGMPIFSYIKENPETENIFHAGIGNRGRLDATAIVDAYDFSACRKVVDVGGGNGSLLSAIITAHEHVSGVLLEREAAIAAAESGRGGPLPRCELVVGDFFKSVPPDADTYILKMVIHNWSDDHAVRILENCRNAVARDGRLLIIEGIFGQTNELTMTHFMDLAMLVLQTGRERTAEEYDELLKRVGLRLERIIPTASAFCILESVVD